MQKLECKNCGKIILPEEPHLGEDHRVYAECKCDNCGLRFKAVYEFVGLLIRGTC